MTDIFASFERDALWIDSAYTATIMRRDTTQIPAKRRLTRQPAKKIRLGWAELFRLMAERSDYCRLLDQTTNSFDTKEWRW